MPPSNPSARRSWSGGMASQGCGCLLLISSSYPIMSTAFHHPSPVAWRLNEGMMGSVDEGGRKGSMFWGLTPSAAAAATTTITTISSSSFNRAERTSALFASSKQDHYSHQNFRPLGPENFASNYKPIDKSGNPEKMQELDIILPGCDIEKLCKEVPDVLIWPTSELKARLEILAKALPGYDLPSTLSEAPTILIGAPYLKETLKQFEEWFPGKTLPELMPRYMDSHIGNAPRPLSYPSRLDWEIPYLDPGLMGNFSVQNDLIEAMRRSQHLTFGLWKEDEEALSKFVDAARRAVLAFETRVFFLRDHYQQEHFERYYADDLFGETVGHAEEWAKKHPGYDSYMDDHLAGYQGMESFRLKRLSVLEKEELMIQARAEGVLGPTGAVMLPGQDQQSYASSRRSVVQQEDAEDGWEDMGDEEEEEDNSQLIGADNEDEFVQAMQQALWTFEVRAGFLERYFGTETYRGEVIRRARQETAGSAEEFLERYPAYEEHLHEVLDGWRDITAEEWEGIHVDAKEDQLVEMLKARGRAMISLQKELNAEPDLPLPPVIKERATESREEARAKLAAEEEAVLENLSDEEVKRHWIAYEEYVKKRFPNLEEERKAREEEEEEEQDLVSGGSFQ